MGLVTVRYNISFLPAAGQWPARRGVRASGGGSGGSGRQMETATGTDLKHPRPQARLPTRLPARLLCVPGPRESRLGVGRAGPWALFSAFWAEAPDLPPPPTSPNPQAWLQLPCPCLSSQHPPASLVGRSFERVQVPGTG